MYISDWAKFRYRNRKSTEESGNDLQKTLIFTPLTKRISRFWKKIMVDNGNGTDFFKRTVTPLMIFNC